MAETGSKFLLSSKSDSAYLLQRWIPNGYGVNLNSRLCFDFGTATENASKSTSYTHKVREMRVPEIEQKPSLRRSQGSFATSNLLRIYTNLQVQAKGV
jgi:hypothetical protein